MVRKSFCGIFFIICLLVNGALSDAEKKNDEKTVAKRGILHLGIHSHPVYTAPHYHIPQAIPAVPKIPIFAKVPTVIAKPIIPVSPPVIPYHITPGNAHVTNVHVNYPRYPFLHKAVVPVLPPPVVPTPAFIPPHYHNHAVFPHHHHHAYVPHNYHAVIPHHHHHAVVPHVHTIPKPIVPVAVPVPGIRQPKFPVFVQNRPTFLARPQFAPSPTFVPIPIPSQPAPAHPPVVMSVNPGINSPNFPPQTSNPTPTSPTYIHPQHGTLAQGVFTQQPPFNYPVYGPPPTSGTSNVLSGQGQVSSQLLAHQLALYQHQQQQQQLIQEQHNSFPYPVAAETFSQNYESASNEGSYHGLSSYQVPMHHQ